MPNLLFLFLFFCIDFYQFFDFVFILFHFFLHDLKKVQITHLVYRNIMSAMVNTDFLVRAREDKCSQIHIGMHETTRKKENERPT